MRAAEFGRRVADAAGDGVGEADVAGKVRIAADHPGRAARHLQLLVAGAVEQRELADRRHLVEQLRVVGIVLGQRLGVGAGHPADLPLQFRDRLLDPPGGGFRLLAHRAGERRLRGAVGDPGLHRAVDREHEDHESYQREHVFGEQALPERPDLVLDADHPDPRKQPPRRPSLTAVLAGVLSSTKGGVAARHPPAWLALILGSRSLIPKLKLTRAKRAEPPLPWGEVDAKRRVRGYSLTMDLNPSPQPSPFGRGSTPPSLRLQEPLYRLNNCRSTSFIAGLSCCGGGASFCAGAAGLA